MNCILSHLKTKKMISDISPELLLLLADVEEQVAFDKTLPNAVQEQSVRTEPDNWVAQTSIEALNNRSGFLYIVQLGLYELKNELPIPEKICKLLVAICIRLCSEGFENEK